MHVHRFPLLRVTVLILLIVGAVAVPGRARAQADVTPPDTTITGTPPNPQTFSSEFAFTGSDDVTPADQLTFECSLDSAAFTACGSPYEVMDLLPGFHTFAVRAVDTAGNVDPTPASYTWEVRPICGNFQMSTIYVDWTGIIRGGPDNGQPYLGVLNGTEGRDVITGSSFDDTINALGGDDFVCAGYGNDTVNAGAGNDTISTFEGNDVLRGGGGNDTLNAGPGFDQLYGDAGADSLNGSLGNDVLYGGGGNDTLVGGPANIPPGAFDSDAMYGEGGNDRLTGGALADFFSGGPGTDTNTDFAPTKGDTWDGT